MKNTDRILLEVCADSAASACAANCGGADRIELCSNLIIGGTTPTRGLFEQVKEQVSCKVNVLIRPRFGDFLYEKEEIRAMISDIRMLIRLGADGIVIGALKKDGNLNLDAMKEMIQAADGTPVTLHRAFDVCRDWKRSLDEAIELGIGTILTSGQENDAWQGRETIRQMQEYSQNHITIMAGSGVKSSNIEALYQITKAAAFHMSAKKTMESAMEFRREGISMGLPGLSEFMQYQTDAEEVKCAAQIMQKYR